MVERSGQRAPGEAIYLRDEDTGEIWGPTALPIREDGASYVARHGQGYSRFEHDSHGIALELLQYVPVDDPIKISRLKIADHSGRVAAAVGHRLCRMGARRVARRLGALRRHRDRCRDRARCSRAIRGASSSARRVAFADLAGRQTVLDRRPARSSSAATARWTGRRRLPARRRCPTGSAPGSIPAARCRPGWNCTANGTVEIVFLLGEAATKAEARALLTKYRAADLDAVLRRGHRLLGRCAGRGSGEDPGSRHGHSVEPLAALSDPCLPRLGACRLLPGERRLRFSRPAAGCDGALRGAAGR